MDSDADGLADWQGVLGTFGWFSNPTLADTDADGVNDFDEVFQNTDPNESHVQISWMMISMD